MRARQEQAVSSPPVVLRPYQKQVITDVYELIRQQIKRILIFAPTGAGKTLIASQIMAHAVIRARKVVFVVHRDILVSQTSDKLTRFGLSECCGYIKSGWKENKDAPVQIASVQTLAKRDWWQEIEANVILLDECHLTAFADVTKKMMAEIFPNAIYLGLTATPWRLSPTEGLGDIFNGLASAPMPKELIDSGFLIKPSYYGVDRNDLEKVKTIGGEFDETELAIACDRPELINQIVHDWFRLARARPTIAFAVSVQHSKNICTAFQERGIPAAHIDGNTPTRVRDRIYQQLSTGEILILSSCMALTEGFDVPEVSCVLLCRPTKSKALYFQMVGRGLRLSPRTDKYDCIVLDQSGSAGRFGFIEDLKEVSLVQGTEAEKDVAPQKVCPQESGGCGAILYAFFKRCPKCGFNFEKQKLIVAFGLKQKIRDEDWSRVIFYREKLKYAYDNQFAPSWAAMIFKEKFGHFPPDDWAMGAIFGDAPTEVQKQIYGQHLQQIAARLSKSFSWVERYLKMEFGLIIERFNSKQ